MPYLVEALSTLHSRDWWTSGQPSHGLAFARAYSARLEVTKFEILQHEGPHVVGTNFGKLIGGGIFELRLDQDAVVVDRARIAA